MGALFVFASGVVLASAACVAVEPGAVQRSPSEIALAAYPPGSIRTLAAADAALRDALLVKPAQEARYAEAKRICYAKFLAESCLNEARQANYMAIQRIREVELEARQFKRSEEAAAIDRRRAEASAADAAAAPQRAADAARMEAERRAKQLTVERTARQFEADTAARAARARDVASQASRRAAERARAAAEEKARSPERAERAQKQAAKVRETLLRAERREREAADKARLTPAPAADTPPP